MDRDPIDARIEYDGFQEPCPSSAWGRFLGYKWDLYARWDQWDFTLSVDPQVNPGSLDLRDAKLKDVPPGVFFRQRKFANASFMTDDEKRRVVRECVAEFVQERQSP